MSGHQTAPAPSLSLSLSLSLYIYIYIYTLVKTPSPFSIHPRAVFTACLQLIHDPRDGKNASLIFLNSSLSLSLSLSSIQLDEFELPAKVLFPEFRVFRNGWTRGG